METWVPKLLESLDKKKVKTIKATGDMLLLPGGEEEEKGMIMVVRVTITTTIPTFGFHQHAPSNW